MDEATKTKPGKEHAQDKAKFGNYGFDTAGQDLSVKPGDDFFEYANGKYIKELQMPGDQSSWGSFDILSDQSLHQTRDILEKEQKAGSKLGNFYAAFMNEDLVEVLDDDPIQPTLLQVAALRNGKEFAALVGSANRNFLPSPLAVGVGADQKDIKNYCVSVDQSGLGMARDYYLKPEFAKKKEAYKTYAAELLELGGFSRSDAKQASEDIIAFEDKIAKVSWSEAQQRDPIKNYNLMKDVNDLKKQAPGFDWDAFLKEAGGPEGALPRDAKLVVGAIGGVQGIAKLLGETDMKVLRSYLAFHYIANVAPYLSTRFVNTAFKFAKVMSGQKELSPRWKRGVRSANAHLGMDVGKKYTEKYFPQSSKTVMLDLTGEVKHAFKERLKKVSWMSETTRQKAQGKLAKFDIQIGFPEKWRDYSGLMTDETDLYGNVLRAIAFSDQYELGHLGKPVDRTEWSMTPQTVNAYNQPTFNQVVFPAAILQPPFFDPNADMAVNFGGIGAVIGHEMTHGFDDQGRQYNAEGQLEDWWTDKDASMFKEKAHAYTDQFAKFDLGIPDAHIKPDVTMGEDIADLGGLTLALQAYQKWAEKRSKKVELDRVFYGWAQVWREKKLEAALLQQLASDPHPPAQARVDIPTRNIGEWYTAFDVKPGETNYLPESDRVVIW